MADSAPTPSYSRTRTTLMVMSLCLNVGLIALILVGIGRVGAGFIAQPGVMAPAQIARGLPPQQREKILDIVAAHREAMRERRQAARRARLEAFRVFGAPDYSAADFTRSRCGAHRRRGIGGRSGGAAAGCGQHIDARGAQADRRTGSGAACPAVLAAVDAAQYAAQSLKVRSRRLSLAGATP